MRKLTAKHLLEEVREIKKQAASWWLNPESHRKQLETALAKLGTETDGLGLVYGKTKSGYLWELDLGLGKESTKGAIISIGVDYDYKVQGPKYSGRIRMDLKSTVRFLNQILKQLEDLSFEFK